MKWGRRSEPRGYHHGNLKEALVRAALDLIAEKGPAGFTFADAARSAGVSPAAPYRHFRDRDALLADVARRGFEQFAAALAKAWDDGKPDALDAPSTGWAGPISPLPNASRPITRRCSRPALPLDADPQLREVSERAFAVLRAAAEKLVALMPAQGRPPALMVALHIWSMTHGIASLFARGDAGAAHAADAAGGTAGGGGADLSARAGP